MAVKTFDLSVILKMIDRFSGPLRQSTANFNRYIDNIKKSETTLAKFGQNLGNIGKTASIALTAPLIIAGIAAVKTAVSFEDAWTGVRKTVNATPEEFAKIQDGMKNLAKTIPLTQEEIYGIGEAAGQLGIHTEDILSFTKVMADLGATTNLSAQDAATQLARFANIVQMPQSKFDRLGATVVDLGNNLATTEAEIVGMGLRIAGAGHLVNMTEAQIFGLAGALSSLGIETETGGTSISQVIQRINKEVGTGSAKMKAFAFIAGKSVKDFETLWKKDAVSGIIAFSQGLKRMDKEGKNVSAILDMMQFDGFRVSDTLLRLAGSGTLLSDSISRASNAWEQNLALTKEANLRYNTTGSQLRIARNRLRELSASFGESLTPALLKMIGLIQPFIDNLAKSDDRTKTWIVSIGAAAAAIGPLLIGLAAIIKSISIIAASTWAAPIIAGIAAFTVAVIAANKSLDDMKLKSDSIGESLKKLVLGMGEVTGVGQIMGLFRLGKMAFSPEYRQEQMQKFAQQNYQNNSKADVTVRVMAERGASAQVDDVKKKGDMTLQIMNEYHLGPGLGWGY